MMAGLCWKPKISGHYGRQQTVCRGRTAGKCRTFLQVPGQQSEKSRGIASCACISSLDRGTGGWKRWREEVRIAAISSPHGFGSVTQSEKTHKDPVDIVILTNGPGEVATWVKPVVEALRSHFGGHAWDLRISVVLAPCPHASGGELQLLQSFDEIDRCQGPESFWQLLLLGCTVQNWDWHKRGVCIFLGGDQFSALVVGFRLGYKTVVYAEDVVQWPGLVDAYLLRSEETMVKVPQWARARCRVVGDLFADAVASSTRGLFSGTSSLGNQSMTTTAGEPVPVVGLLPGSKDAKLAIGVPYFMAVAEHLHERMEGHVRFILPLAPTVSLDVLARHADPAHNPLITRFNWAPGQILFHQREQTDRDHGQPIKSFENRGAGAKPCKGRAVGMLVTKGQVHIEIWQQFPPYSLFQRCTLCLTTVGTNTAELGCLGVPMLVVLPTHALEMFRGATGGVIGLLAAVPGWVGSAVAHLANLAVLNSAGFMAWPNRWAGEEVVPELIGKIEPVEVAAVAAQYLEAPAQLQLMHERLLNLQQKMPPSDDEAGAASAITFEVEWLLQQ